MTISLTPDTSYRLSNDIKIGNYIFQKGEIVIYGSGGYSPYDDCYIYHFINADGENQMCISQTELTDVDMENFGRVN